MHPVMRQALRAVIPACDVDAQDVRESIEDHVAERLCADVDLFGEFMASTTNEAHLTLYAWALPMLQGAAKRGDRAAQALIAEFIAWTKSSTNTLTGKPLFDSLVQHISEAA